MSGHSTDDSARADTSDRRRRFDRVRRAIELTPQHPPDEVAAFGSIAENNGFDAAFVSNHYFNRDPFVTLTRMVAETDTIRLGPGVVNPFEAHPVTVASRTATIDEVSDGRAVCGIGAGDRSALRALGVDVDRPLERVLETMQVARRLWDGETVTHEGTFTVEDAALNFETDSIPLYVGAQGPHMLRMSAKYADGILVNGSHPADLEWASERIAEGRDERPHHRGHVETLAFASVSVDSDKAAAREAARPPVAFIAASAPSTVLDRHGLDEDAVASVADALGEGDLRTAFGLVTPSMIDAFSIAGTPEQVTSRFEALDPFVDGIVVGSPLGPDEETAISAAANALEDAGFGE